MQRLARATAVSHALRHVCHMAIWNAMPMSKHAAVGTEEPPSADRSPNSAARATESRVPPRTRAPHQKQRNVGTTARALADVILGTHARTPRSSSPSSSSSSSPSLPSSTSTSLPSSSRTSSPSLHRDGASTSQRPRLVVEVVVPPETAGRVIGAGGVHIRITSAISGAGIEFVGETKPGAPLVLRIVGSPDAVSLAQRIIGEQADPANVDGHTTVAVEPGPGPIIGKVIMIPNDPVDVGRIVGRNMRTLIHLRKMTGVYARLERDTPASTPTRKLTLIGTRTQVAKASDVVHYLRLMNRPSDSAGGERDDDRPGNGLIDRYDSMEIEVGVRKDGDGAHETYDSAGVGTYRTSS